MRVLVLALAVAVVVAGVVPPVGVRSHGTGEPQSAVWAAPGGDAPVPDRPERSQAHFFHALAPEDPRLPSMSALPFAPGRVVPGEREGHRSRVERPPASS